jgi:hypothetical protein
LRVHAIAILSTMLVASLLSVPAAHGECVRIPLQQVVTRQDVQIVFKGTAVSITPITPDDPQQTSGFKVTFDVERIWKGSVGKRVELYMDLNGNNPQFEAGHSSPVFVEYLVDPTVRGRLGITGTDTGVSTAVGCTGIYSESEITAALGAGAEPLKATRRRGARQR